MEECNEYTHSSNTINNYDDGEVRIEIYNENENDISNTIDSISNLNTHSILTQDTNQNGSFLRHEPEGPNINQRMLNQRQQEFKKKEFNTNKYLQTVNNEKDNRAEISTINIKHDQTNRILLKNYSSKELKHIRDISSNKRDMRDKRDGSSKYSTISSSFKNLPTNNVTTIRRESEFTLINSQDDHEGQVYSPEIIMPKHEEEFSEIPLINDKGSIIVKLNDKVNDKDNKDRKVSISINYEKHNEIMVMKDENDDNNDMIEIRLKKNKSPTDKKVKKKKKVKKVKIIDDNDMNDLNENNIKDRNTGNTNNQIKLPNKKTKLTKDKKENVTGPLLECNVEVNINNSQANTNTLKNGLKQTKLDTKTSKIKNNTDTKQNSKNTKNTKSTTTKEEIKIEKVPSKFINKKPIYWLGSEEILPLISPEQAMFVILLNLFIPGFGTLISSCYVNDNILDQPKGAASVNSIRINALIHFGLGVVFIGWLIGVKYGCDLLALSKQEITDRIEKRKESDYKV